MRDIERPYARAATLTPADGADTAPCEAIYVGGAGDITCTMSGVDVVFKAVPVGSVLKICPTRVKATGTTATLMLALRT